MSEIKTTSELGQGVLPEYATPEFVQFVLSFLTPETILEIQKYLSIRGSLEPKECEQGLYVDATGLSITAVPGTITWSRELISQ